MSIHKGYYLPVSLEIPNNHILRALSKRRSMVSLSLALSSLLRTTHCIVFLLLKMELPILSDRYCHQPTQTTLPLRCDVFQLELRALHPERKIDLLALFDNFPFQVCEYT